jgi:hypothetical protein
MRRPSDKLSRDVLALPGGNSVVNWPFYIEAASTYHGPSKSAKYRETGDEEGLSYSFPSIPSLDWACITDLQLCIGEGERDQ